MRGGIGLRNRDKWSKNDVKVAVPLPPLPRLLSTAMTSTPISTVRNAAALKRSNLVRSFGAMFCASVDLPTYDTTWERERAKESARKRATASERHGMIRRV